MSKAPRRQTAIPPSHRCLQAKRRIGAVATTLLLTIACAKTTSAPGGDTTQIPTSQATPTPSTTTPSTGVTSPAASTAASTAAITASMTIAPSLAPDLCVTVDPNSTGTPLAFRICTLADNQRFVLVGGLLQSALGVCVGLVNTADPDQPGAVATPVVGLAACDGNNAGQQIQRVEDMLMAAGTPSYRLATIAAPTSTSPVVFASSSTTNTSFSWLLGSFSHDGNGVLLQGGTSIVSMDAPTQCLTGATSGVSLAACVAGAAGQAWNFGAVGAITSQGLCLQGSGNNVVTGACTADNSQDWMLTNGQIVNTQTGACLATNGTTLVQQPCSPGTDQFAVGSHN